MSTEILTSSVACPLVSYHSLVLAYMANYSFHKKGIPVRVDTPFPTENLSKESEDLIDQLILDGALLGLDMPISTPKSSRYRAEEAQYTSLPSGTVRTEVLDDEKFSPSFGRLWDSIGGAVGWWLFWLVAFVDNIEVADTSDAPEWYHSGTSEVPMFTIEVAKEHAKTYQNFADFYLSTPGIPLLHRTFQITFGENTPEIDYHLYRVDSIRQGKRRYYSLDEKHSFLNEYIPGNVYVLWWRDPRTEEEGSKLHRFDSRTLVEYRGTVGNEAVFRSYPEPTTRAWRDISFEKISSDYRGDYIEFINAPSEESRHIFRLGITDLGIGLRFFKEEYILAPLEKSNYTNLFVYTSQGISEVCVSEVDAVHYSLKESGLVFNEEAFKALYKPSDNYTWLFDKVQ